MAEDLRPVWLRTSNGPNRQLLNMDTGSILEDAGNGAKLRLPGQRLEEGKFVTDSFDRIVSALAATGQILEVK